MTLALFGAAPSPPVFAGLSTEGDETSWAVFSHPPLARDEEAFWRYLLCRVWDPDKPLTGWLCANPSDADAFENDPSVRKMIGFAKRRGSGGILLANALGAATPYPEALLERDDPMGPRNVELVGWLAQHPCIDVLIGGWGGAVPKKLRSLAQQSIHEAALHRSIMCLGTTADGSPRHPLMLSYSTLLKPWASRLSTTKLE